MLANVEASLVAKPTAAATLRAFIGLSYDDRVPGISAPSYTGTFGVATSLTPASIYFSGQTSYYAGGGVTLKFEP